MDLLFVYGTLLQQENYFGHYLKNNSRLIAKGNFRGLLYDIGSYPGAIYLPQSDTYVHGAVLKLNKGEKDLEIIDQYEGYGENELQPNEFVRTTICVECGTVAYKAWAYLYARPVNHLIHIKSGDYLRFVSEKSKKKSPDGSGD